jgi:hypothetical protein
MSTFATEDFWWRGWCDYAEWLCAQCYDDMVANMKSFEEEYREEEWYEEDTEYTKLLESL